MHGEKELELSVWSCGNACDLFLSSSFVVRTSTAVALKNINSLLANAFGVSSDPFAPQDSMTDPH